MAEIDKTKSNESGDEKLTLPVLPLRDIVMFPHMIVPLFVGREKSVLALEEVMASGKKILLLAQRDPEEDAPTLDGLFPIGTLGNILQMLKLPDGTIKVLIEGQDRVRVHDLKEDSCLRGRYEVLPEAQEDTQEQEQVARAVVNQFEAYAKLNKKIAPEVLVSVSGVEGVDRLADTIASHLSLKVEEKQQLLEMTSVIERLEKIFAFMEEEMDMLQVDKRVRSRVKNQMEKSQREYYLSEQMKAIQKELGEEGSH
ncbi:MAG: LON peptidase substrate-binding domain-containing protein, partial [Ghiorsea sp.]